MLSRNRDTAAISLSGEAAPGPCHLIPIPAD